MLKAFTQPIALLLTAAIAIASIFLPASASATTLVENPVKDADSALVAAASETDDVLTTPDTNELDDSSDGTQAIVFLAQNGQLVIEAESAELQGNWKPFNISGRDAVLYDGPNSFRRVPDGQTLEYLFETDAGGNYFIAFYSARNKAVMNVTTDDQGNDAYIAIENVLTGEEVLEPTKLFTSLRSSDLELRWGNRFDLETSQTRATVPLAANTQYRLLVSGRSDGFVIDRMTFNIGSFFRDADALASPIKLASDGSNAPPVAESDTVIINDDAIATDGD